MRSQLSKNNIFINKAILIHSDKYDYSKIIFINNTTKIEIICPIHGSFWQLPKYHISKKRGCKECSYDNIRVLKNKSINIDHDSNFKKTCIIKYRNKYIYIDKIKNHHLAINILCKKHLLYFKQTPMSHLKYSACPSCSLNRKKEKFIKKSRIIHSDKYDYSKIIFINNTTKIEIICPIHGSFWQLPKYHISKYGCPSCSSSKGENLIQEYLLNNNIKFIKENRFYNCKSKNTLPFDFYLIDLNICIEYDGIQHFKPIEFFGGDKSLKQIKLRDNIKTQFCIDNNIELIRFNYKQTKNKIKDILNEKIYSETINRR